MSEKLKTTREECEHAVSTNLKARAELRLRLYQDALRSHDLEAELYRLRDGLEFELKDRSYEATSAGGYTRHVISTAPVRALLDDTE